MSLCHPPYLVPVDTTPRIGASSLQSRSRSSSLDTLTSPQETRMPGKPELGSCGWLQWWLKLRWRSGVPFSCQIFVSICKFSDILQISEISTIKFSLEVKRLLQVTSSIRCDNWLSECLLLLGTLFHKKKHTESKFTWPSFPAMATIVRFLWRNGILKQEITISNDVWLF